MPRILVAGVGNVFFGDDGFGCAVLRRLVESPLPEGVVATDFGIRGVHLAYELANVDQVLVMIDAVKRGDPPGTVSVIEPDFGAPSPDDEVAGAHGMHLPQVIAAARALGPLPPRIVLVAGEIEDVGEGMGLSPAVARAVDVAVERALALVSSAGPSPCRGACRSWPGSDP